MIRDKENILRLIGGEYVAAATKQLPDPNAAKEEFQETVMEVPNLGKGGLPAGGLNQSTINR